MESVPYLVADGDTLANLASREMETVSALRLFNLQLARYPASASLPAGGDDPAAGERGGGCVNCRDGTAGIPG